jgi:hypothetical protein
MPLESMVVVGVVIGVLILFGIVLAYGDWTTNGSHWKRD